MTQIISYNVSVSEVLNTTDAILKYHRVQVFG